MKDLFIGIFCIAIGIFIGNILYSGNNKAVEKTVQKIDTLYNDRVTYLKDTVYVQKKIIVSHFDTVQGKIDSIFSGSDSSKKSDLFNSTYVSEDTLKFINISSDQAKQAIEVKNLWIRDSSLLDLCEKNVSQCDGTLVQIKTQVDSLKNIKIPEDHTVRNFAYGVVSGIILTIGFEFLLNK